MTKTILITGSTDGLGLETAKALQALGHRVLLHGRSPEKLERAQAAVGGNAAGFTADLSDLPQVAHLAETVATTHERVDVLINNAGVFATPRPRLASGLDVRFAVNTIAPYLLTQRLLARMGTSGRVVNLSSAAQAPVNLRALAGEVELDDSQAYAQSKLALTMWSRVLGLELKSSVGPMIVAVNPGSLLATKMVKEAYGKRGSDIGIGVDILRRAALEQEFAGAHGQYFDNDSGRFAPPHPDALNERAARAVTEAVASLAG